MGTVMKQWLMAAGALATALSSGLARAEVGSPDQAWTGWSGFYGGIEVGGKFTNSDWRNTGVNDFLSGAVVPDSGASARLSAAGPRGGVFTGYNWQIGRLVVGPDIDVGFADDSKRLGYLPGCGSVTSCNGGSGPLPPNPLADDFLKINSTWDANVRGRLGYLLGPDLLVFATGGLALQEVEVSAGCRAALWDPLCAGPPNGNNQTKTQTNSALLLGWTAGVGMEARLDQHWHLRGEYRYAGFSPTSGTFWANQPAGLAGWDAYHYNVSLETHIANLGLSYNF